MCEREYHRKQYDKIIKFISTTSKYTFSSPRLQAFSLPMEIIDSIFYQKTSPYFLLKVYQTCKYFFKKKMILPLVTTPSITCFEAHVYYSPKEFNCNKKVLFWFCKDLCLYRAPGTTLNRIYACTNLKELNIQHITFSLNEFNFIVSGSQIETLYFHLADIVDSNGLHVPINVILQKLPYCTNLRYRNEKENFSKQTLLAMNEIHFANRFIQIQIFLEEVEETFDAKLLLQFYHKNIDTKTISSLVMTFLTGENKNVIENMVKNAYGKVFWRWIGKRPIQIYNFN